MTKEVVVVDGTTFHKDTPNEVIRILNDAIKYRKRLRIFLGDKETGKDWMEEYDVIGYIGRSTGDSKVPLLISSKSSSGGGAILTDSIVKININKHTAYVHPKYHLPNLTIHPVDEGAWVHADNEPHAKLASPDKANKYIRFLKGDRNIK